ncbi:MAG: hypothetical protein R2784_12370 [Saprospiraceae bacterium]
MFRRSALENYFADVFLNSDFIISAGQKDLKNNRTCITTVREKSYEPMDPILDAEPRESLKEELVFQISISLFKWLDFLLISGLQRSPNVLNQVMSFVDFRILIKVFLFFSLLDSPPVISILKEKKLVDENRGVFLNIFLLFLIIGFMIFGNIGWY